MSDDVFVVTVVEAPSILGLLAAADDDVEALLPLASLVFCVPSISVWRGTSPEALTWLDPSPYLNLAVVLLE